MTSVALDRVRSLPPVGRRVAIAAGLFLAWLVIDNALAKGLPPGIIFLGVVFGSLYGLLAVGIVLIYRANRVINFAQAELGSVAAVVAIQLVIQQNVNYFVAIGAGFVLAAVMGAGINALVIRRFRNAPRLIVAVATIGLAQILNAISLLIPIFWSGADAGTFETPFSVSFSITPVIFDGNHVVAILATTIVMAGIGAFLRFTDYGVAIRAAAANGDRAALVGIPVPRLATITWAMAGLVSALAVILRVPLLGFVSFSSVSGGGNALLLVTLAAAVLGRMESLPRTVLAAIGIGIFQQAASWYYSNTTFVDALLVGVILIGLLLQRDAFSRAAETGISTWQAIKEVRPVPAELRDVPEVRWVARGLKALLAVVVLTLPLWASPSQEEAAALLCIYAIVALSLVVLTGWAGQISLGQFALVGFGAAGSGLLYGKYGLDFFPAAVGGVLLAAGVALVIGLPALRIKGPFLAVTTLAFAVTASTFFLEERYLPWFVTEERVERPILWQRITLTESWRMYLFALAGLVLAFLAIRNVRASRTGRALIAVRDNELASESVSLSATRMKLTAFVLSGAVAGFAGALYMVSQTGVKPGAFGPDVSIRLFSMVVIGGLGSLPGAVLGAAYVRGTEFFLPPAYELLASGVGILFLLLFVPEGLGGLVYRVRDAYLRRVAKKRGLRVPSLLADTRVEDEPEVDAIGSGAALLDESREPVGAAP